MKKSAISTVILLAVTLIAAGAFCAFAGTSSAIPATRAFTPKANGYMKVTKGSSAPVDVSKASAIRNLCTADCTYQLNGTGPAWLLKANAPETIYVPVGVRSIVFSVTSSAGTGIYTQTQ